MSLYRVIRTITTRLPRAKPLTRYSFAPFSSTPAAMTTITKAITEDHRELEEYYNTIINATDADTQTRYQNQFTWELARHSVGEELVVYPAMEKYMGADGKAKADHDRQEHHKVRVPSLPRFVSCLQRLLRMSSGQRAAQEVSEPETIFPRIHSNSEVVVGGLGTPHRGRGAR